MLRVSGGQRLLVLSWVAFAAAAMAPAASAMLSASGSHPSQVQVNEVYTVTVTVSNTVQPATGTAAGVRLTMTADPDETLLAMSASQGTCASTPEYRIDCQLGDIAPGQTVAMSYTGTAPAAGSIFHTVSARTATFASDFGVSIDVLDGAPPPPPPDADLEVGVSPAERTSGLRATHSVTVRNIGSDTAPNVLLDMRLVWGETLDGLTFSQGNCSLNLPGIHCELGSLSPAATANLTLRTRLPFNPSGDSHVAQASVPGTSNPIRSAFAPAVFGGRYWICHICGSSLLTNGYELPGPAGAVTHPDDTVVLSDGSIIRIDGTLLLPTGQVVLPNGMLLPPTGSGAGTPSGPPTAPAPVSTVPPATPASPAPAAPAPTQAVAPTMLTRPRVGGAARVGSRLLGHPGRWSSGSRVTLVRWRACRARTCTILARGNTLRLRTSHIGMRIRLEVRTTKAGRTATAASAWTTPVRR